MYFPKCRKDAQCKCSMCEASLNATRDLRPSSTTPSSSGMFRFNALGLGFGSPLPLSRSAKDSPLSASYPAARMLEPVFEEAAQTRKGGAVGWSTWAALLLLLLATLEFVLPWAQSQVYTPVLSPEAVSRMVEESRVRSRVVDRLDLLQHRIRRLVGSPDVSNCTGSSSVWTLSEEGPLLRSSCRLYSSPAEQVSVWGYPMATAGVLSRDSMDRAFVILSGRLIKWREGQVEYSIHKEGDSWAQSRWSAAAVHLDRDTWVIEYRGLATRKQLASLSAASQALSNLLWYRLTKVRLLLDATAAATGSFTRTSLLTSMAYGTR